MFGLYDDPGKGTVTTNTTDEKKNDPASHTVDLQKLQREYVDSLRNAEEAIDKLLKENRMVPFTKEEKVMLQEIYDDYVTQEMFKDIVAKVGELLDKNEADIHDTRDRQKVHTWFIVGLIVTTIILFFRRKK